jgi:CHASE3 domain sensor protein
MEKTITLPQKTIDNLLDNLQKVQDAQDELEDYLLSQNPEFIERMRRARKDDLAGRTKPLEELMDTHV